MAFADTLSDAARNDMRLIAGNVTATAAAQVVVDVVGSEMTLPRLSWYAPVVGDTVLILPSQIGWIVLGKVAV